jgi:hypothetical protein
MTTQLARGGVAVQNIIGLLVGLIVIIVLVYLVMNLL